MNRRRELLPTDERETPSQLPAMGVETRFKTTLGTAWTVAAGIVGAAIWGTILYLDIQTLKAHDAENTAKIEQIRTDVSRVIWILEPPQSRAVVGQSNKQPQRNP